MSSTFPEHDRLSAFVDEQSTLSEFLEWLRTQNIVLCKLEENGKYNGYGPVEEYFPIRESDQNLVHRHLGLDPLVLERERREMLNALTKPPS